MASFKDALEKLLREAVGRNIVTADQAAGIVDLARSSPPNRAFAYGKLARTLTLIGGFGLVLGLILLISANWWDISAPIKLAGFLVLFLACHLGGLWLRWKHPDHDGTAEALNFIGGGLFLTGVALVAQVFHINENPINGMRVWLLAIAPLAFLLRSTPLFSMSLLAALVWGSWEFAEYTLSRHIDRAVAFPFAATLPFAVLCIGLLGERVAASMGTVCRVVSGIMIGVSLYLLGFFRHFDRFDFSEYGTRGAWIGTWMIGFFCAALVLALLSHILKPGPKRMVEHAYLALTLATVAVLMMAAALLSGWWHPGERMEQFAFSGARMLTFHTRIVLNTALAWLLWFLWGVWFVFAGSAWRRNDLVALGVYGIAFGLVTRYFDLIGTLEETGMYFVGGGVVLILVGWGAEKCRRRLSKKATETAENDTRS